MSRTKQELFRRNLFEDKELENALFDEDDDFWIEPLVARYQITWKDGADKGLRALYTGNSDSTQRRAHDQKEKRIESMINSNSLLHYGFRTKAAAEIEIERETGSSSDAEDDDDDDARLRALILTLKDNPLLKEAKAEFCKDGKLNGCDLFKKLCVLRYYQRIRKDRNMRCKVLASEHV
jgi:hypothetical protein